MDQINESKNTENIVKNESNKTEQKIRHNRYSRSNNDLWIHVDAHNAETNKFMTLLTGISTLAAISLVVVSLIQHNQTTMLTKQNEVLLEKYSQAMTQMNAGNVEAINELEAGLSSVVNSIDKLTIAMQHGTPVVEGTQTETIVTPADDTAFFGVVVMNDGTAVTPLGLRIAGIYDNSPASIAGIRAGDILMSIDDITIDSFDTMSAIIDTKKPGDTMNVRFARTQENTVFFENVDVILDSISNYDTDLSKPTPQP